MRKSSKSRVESITVFSSVAAERLADYRGDTDTSPNSPPDTDGIVIGSMSGCITGGQEADPSPSSTSSHHDQPTTSKETSKTKFSDEVIEVSLVAVVSVSLTSCTSEVVIWIFNIYFLF
ncbi:uncharacterized protein LOC143237543 isoform X2 [Tachypleus tridentatus]